MSTFQRVLHPKRVITWVVMWVMLGTLLMTGMATSQAFTGPGANDPAMPSTWNQNDPKWNAIPLGRSNPSLGAYGCAQFSLTNLYRKAGARDEKYMPDGFRQESLNQLDKGGSAGITEDGYLDWNGAAAMSGKFTFEGTENTSSIERLKQLSNDGYMLTLWVLGGSHWIAVDYVEGDTIWIVDSGLPNTTKLNDPGYNLQFLQLQKYKMTDGRKNKDLPKINGMTEESAKEAGKGVTAKPSKNKEEAAKGMISQEDLAGMPKVIPNIQQGVDKIVLPVSNNDGTGRAAKGMVDQMKDAETVTTTSVARGIVSLVGLLAFLWAGLLVVAFSFDRANTMVEFSAMKAVTLGAFRMKVDDDSAGLYDKTAVAQEGKTKDIGLGGLIGVCVILVLLGMALLSGVLYDFFLNGIWFVEDMTGNDPPSGPRV